MSHFYMSSTFTRPIADRSRTRRLGSGFTLTELLVAIVVLLVVILAVGRIFGTVSELVKRGEANADILQEASAIEQLMRRDLARISDEGFLVIQCISVPNNVMQSLGGGQLLDPSKPDNHIFRCDQMAFLVSDPAISRFTQGLGSFEEQDDGRYTGYNNTNNLTDSPTPQATGSFVYYGHGVNYPNLGQGIDPKADVRPDDSAEPTQPWWRPLPEKARLDLVRWPTGGSLGQANASQSAADNWVLARQEVLLADDRVGDPSIYLSGSGPFARNAAAGRIREVMASEDPPGEDRDDAMRDGRVDVWATDFARIRAEIEGYGSDAPRRLANLLLRYRPRAEKRPPTLNRSDVLLTTNMLLSNCSNFVIDWTWSDGIGQNLGLDLDIGFDSNLSTQRDFRGMFRGVAYNGGRRSPVGYEDDVVYEPSGGVPWFGFSGDHPNAGDSNPDVRFASDYLGGNFRERPVRYHAPIAYHPDNSILRGGGNNPPEGDFFDIGSLDPRVVPTIEGPVVDQPFGTGVPVYRYRALFGLNGKQPFILDGQGRPITQVLDPNAGGDAWPIYRYDYTPWPSAIRVTATFHDNRGAIAGGRKIQFTIPIAERVQDLAEYTP